MICTVAFKLIQCKVVGLASLVLDACLAKVLPIIISVSNKLAFHSGLREMSTHVTENSVPLRTANKTVHTTSMRNTTLSIDHCSGEHLHVMDS